MISELPLYLITSLERRLMTAATTTTSPFTGSQEVQDWGGEWWNYAVTIALMRPSDGQRLSAFFTSLGGVRGRFLFRDPSIEAAPAVGLGVVSGAFQSGRSLVTAGWAESTLLFRAGDFFSLGTGTETRLYQVTMDVISNDVGMATLQFIPKLRSTPANGTMIETFDPKLVLRLNEPVPTTVGRAGKFQFTFSAREAL